uniref:Pyruvate kinase n=1 Tax=Diabrotica virgifera virgifera TaxID=50390 RepID=A0A6P7GNQ7_DIAVI
MDCLRNCPKLPWMIDFNSNEAKDVLNNQYEAAFCTSNIDYCSKLNIRSIPARFKSTQIVCSINQNVSLNGIEELLAGGMRVAVLVAPNLEKLKEVLVKVRTMVDIFSRKIRRVVPLGIGLEIKGPEIRIGSLKGNKKQIYMEEGKETKLTIQPDLEEFVNEDMIYVDYDNLPNVVQPGDQVILDNGSVTLVALDCVESIIRCIVERAGMLISNASVTVPNATIPLPAISASDKELLKMAVGECVEYLFVSGIQNKQGVLDVKDILGPRGNTILIVVKIDTEIAVENIDEIIKTADGILIDADRLVIELPKEKVFLIQKSITAKCNLAGGYLGGSVAHARKFIKNERKERKETVNIDLIQTKKYEIHRKQLLIENRKEILGEINEVNINQEEAVQCRPRCPIIVITRYPRVARQLCLYRGVEPLIYLRPFCGEWNRDVDNRVQLGVTYGKLMGYIKMGDVVVTVTSSRPECGMANCMKVIYATEFDSLPHQTRKQSQQSKRFSKR